MPDMDVDGPVDILRALLDGDFDTYQRLHAGLAPEQRPAFAVVLTAAFSEAVVRWFGKERSTADVIEFVAEARAQYPRTAQTVRAEDAEKAIRGALGEENLGSELSGKARGAAQTAMLFAITQAYGASRAGIDALLADAGEQAKAYFRRRAERESQR
jgi:hypothetical protein